MTHTLETIPPVPIQIVSPSGWKQLMHWFPWEYFHLDAYMHLKPLSEPVLLMTMFALKAVL